MHDKQKTSIYRWTRILHRDIGFFVIGLTVIYCISGIMLTYRDTDFLKTERQVETTIEPGLEASQLGRALHLKGMQIVSEDDKEIRFASGTYNKITGAALYHSKELPGILQTFNNLHFVASKDSRHWFTALYALALLFLSLSPFLMYRPGSGNLKRGTLFAISGVLASVVLLLV